MHDPISDMLIRIKNAGTAGKSSVNVPYSKLKFAIASILLREGYISSLSKKGKKEAPQLEVGIAYDDKEPKIKGLSRVSKLSRRIYYGVSDIHRVRQGYGTLILSTSRGIMTGKEARKEKVGGEALFTVW